MTHILNVLYTWNRQTNLTLVYTNFNFLKNGKKMTGTGTGSVTEIDRYFSTINNCSVM